MNRDFKRLIDSLEPSFRQLIEMEPVRIGNLQQNMPNMGIYLFSERDRYLYVGRSNRLRARLNEHCRNSSRHNSAPFAFRITREVMGRKKASYRTEGSRPQLEQDPEFREAFQRAKQRIRRMGIRFVEERNPLRQALLEMYVSIALHTPFNDFDTH